MEYQTCNERALLRRRRCANDLCTTLHIRSSMHVIEVQWTAGCGIVQLSCDRSIVCTAFPLAIWGSALKMPLLHNYVWDLGRQIGSREYENHMQEYNNWDVCMFCCLYLHLHILFITFLNLWFHSVSSACTYLHRSKAKIQSQFKLLKP